MDLYGMRVIVSPFAEKIERKQIRFPRTRKKRIMKKWAKRECNWSVTAKPLAFQTPYGFIVHPTIYNELSKLTQE